MKGGDFLMGKDVVKAKVAVPEVVEYKPLRLEAVNLGKLEGKDFRHAILTDVSGKNAVFENADFSYAVFTRAYFHKAKFINCSFVGARFTECNFRSAEVGACDFRYADFTSTRIDTAEILKNLPDEPNISRELLQILRKNALSMGDVSSSRTFVLSELSAKKEHLRRAWRQDGKYYKSHYNGFWKRAHVGLSRVGLALDSFLWGHGERLWKMTFSIGALLVLAAGASMITQALAQPDPTISSLAGDFVRALTYYANLFLDIEFQRQVPRIIWLEWVIVLARYLAFGVLISGLFRWLSHR